MDNKLKDKLLKSFSEFLEAVVGDSKQRDNIKLIKSLNQEEMREISVVYMPNTEDAHGEWMSESTVAQMCQDLRKGFFEAKELTLNLFHIEPLEKSRAEAVDIYLLEDEIYLDDILVPAGSCVMEVQYHDPILWEMRKSGTIGGFSVHGGRDPFEGEDV